MNSSLLGLGAAFLIIFMSGSVAHAYPAYYDISDTAKAQAEARERHLPLAYLGSFPECLTEGAPNPGSFGDLTQMALTALQGNAVVIFFDGHNMAPVPAIIHAQYHINDDGPIGGGAAWYPPKVVFSNADITKILGRVSHTQMEADREIPLNSALQVIRNDPRALDPLPPAISTPPDESEADDTTANYIERLTGMTNQSLYEIGGSLLVVALLFSWMRRSRH